MKIRIAVISASILLFSGCNKLGSGGVMAQIAGDWAQVKLPQGCVAKQIAAESGSGVAVLCEDGRVFH